MGYVSTTTCAPGLVGLGCDCGLGWKPRGLGLFDSGVDFTGWGLGEWATILLGAYVVGSVLFTSKRAASRVARIPHERRKAKAKRLRAEATKLEKRRNAAWGKQSRERKRGPWFGIKSRKEKRALHHFKDEARYRYARRSSREREESR